MSVNPTIVVVAFDRYRSVKRLLDSLSQAIYPSDVRLVISVDFKNSEGNKKVRDFVESFDWGFGAKEVILHEKNLGLRKHVLSCGDLTQKYGSVIVLEDDLSVGPQFYNYATEAILFAENDGSIAGTSLYTHATKYYLRRLPFTPVADGYDNFYLQIASSWGQTWSSSQWSKFRDWYDQLSADELKNIPASAKLSKTVANWPSCSWLKYFNWYLTVSNRYFLFPRIAHTTNNNDGGTNMTRVSPAWQIPLGFGSLKPRFATVKESLAVYDAFFEIEERKLKRMVPRLAGYDFSVDLYGTKDPKSFDRDFVLTCKKTSGAAELQFPLRLKPIEHNLFIECDTDEPYIQLVRSDNSFGGPKIDFSDRHVVEYLYGPISFKRFAENIWRYFLAR